jgi:hypothetical protein
MLQFTLETMHGSALPDAVPVMRVGPIDRISQDEDQPDVRQSVLNPRWRFVGSQIDGGVFTDPLVVASRIKDRSIPLQVTLEASIVILRPEVVLTGEKEIGVLCQDAMQGTRCPTS